MGRLNHEPLQIIVVGEIGVGKSALCNFLYSGVSGQAGDEEKFRRGHGAEPCTADIQREIFSFNGQSFAIVDTPGFNKVNYDVEKTVDEFREMLDANPITGSVIFVRNGAMPKVSLLEQKILKVIQDTCSDNVDRIFGVCLSNISFSSSAIRKRASRNWTDDSIVDMCISVMNNCDLYCPRKENWFVVDAEFDPDEEEECRIALAARERLLQWAANNSNNQTTFSVDLDP